MKDVIIVLSVLLLAVAIGCSGKKDEGTKQDAAKAVDDMKLENAPTLGPVYVKWEQAAENKDWGTVWDLSSSGEHQWTERELAEIKEKGAAYYEDMKAHQQANMPDPSDERRKNAEARLKTYDKCIADIDKIKAMSSREYFIYDKQNDPNLSEYKANKGAFEKEEINGDEGNLMQHAPGFELTTHFTREGGAWKRGRKAK
jgi:type II secretory pathway pseudopilin PulG